MTGSLVRQNGSPAAGRHNLAMTGARGDIGTCTGQRQHTASSEEGGVQCDLHIPHQQKRSGYMLRKALAKPVRYQRNRIARRAHAGA